MRTDFSTAAQGDLVNYLAQTSSGLPRRPGAVGSIPAASAGKAQGDKAQEERSAAPPKGDPLKPFEPAEKVKADQAIDFPADI